MSARWSDWSAGWHQHWSNSGNITQSDEILIYNFSLEWELWATVAICKKKIAKNINPISLKNIKIFCFSALLLMASYKNNKV